MGAAVALGDVVGERQHRLVVAVVPPHRDLDADPATLAGDEDRFRGDGGLAAVEVFHELAHAAFVEQLGVDRLGRTVVFQDDADAGVQERKLAQAVFQRSDMVVEVEERAGLAVLAGRGEEPNLGPRLARGVAHDAQVFNRVAVFEPGVVFLAIAPDPQFQPFRQRVHDGNADAVQPARDLVAVLVELPARVQLGHDDLGRAHAFGRVHADGDAASVVTHRHAAVGVNLDMDIVGMTGQRLVDAVVHHLVDHVVQTRPVVGVADIHAGPLANGLQSLENLDGFGAVCVRLHGSCAHASFILPLTSMI